MSDPLFSIVINCYRCQAALGEQLAVWHSYTPEMLAQIEFVLVDDGSQPALELKPEDMPPGARLKFARIAQDVPWNMPGARNLGAMLARGRFLIFTDVDHFLLPSSLRPLIDSVDALRQDVAYRFARQENGQPINPHVNSFVCSRDGFWCAGGYDEDFALHYGHEDSYFLMCWQKYSGSLVQLTDVFLDVRPRFATTGLSRDTTRNSMLIRQKIAEDFPRSRQRLRFDWQLV